MEGFVKISQYAGMRPDLIQAAGGNSSIKLDDETMLVKSSGFRLSDITLESGYTKVNYKKLKSTIVDNINNDAYDFKKELDECVVTGLKPSIETYLHAITKKYTLHVHSIVANMILCRIDYEKQLKNALSDVNYITIPYVNPGIDIAKEMIKANRNNDIDIVFMQNHGVIITSDDSNEIIDKYESLMCRLEKYLNIDFTKYHNISVLQNKYKNKYVYLVDRNIKVDDFIYKYCPDNIIYIGNCIDDANSCFETKNSLVKYNGYLYILSNNYKKAIDTMEVIDSIIEINKNVQKDKINILDSNRISKLLEREDEKYRQRL